MFILVTTISGDTKAASGNFSSEIQSGNFLLVTYETANYDKWKVAFDAGETERNKRGIVTRFLFGALDEVDKFLVFFETKDNKSAEDFLKTTQYYDFMKLTGSGSTDKIQSLEVVKLYKDESVDSSGDFAFLNHPVKSLDEWKAIYEAHEALRHGFGMRTLAIFKDNSSPVNVFILMTIKDFQTVVEYGSLPGMSETMEVAGVAGNAGMHLLEMKK